MKNKKKAALVVLGLLTAGVAQADSAPQDKPATLSVTGEVTSADHGCRVALSKDTLAFNMNAGEVIYQGHDATQPQTVNVTIQEGDINGNFCSKAVQNGHIALKFVGQADDADGTALANQYYNEESGATGVGFGFFTEDNKPIAINSGLLKVNDFTPIDQLGTIKFGVQPVRLTNRNITAGMLGAAVTVEIERL
ncbi:fimbrial protein [Cronobacter turicensis]